MVELKWLLQTNDDGYEWFMAEHGAYLCAAYDDGHFKVWSKNKAKLRGRATKKDEQELGARSCLDAAMILAGRALVRIMAEDEECEASNAARVAALADPEWQELRDGVKVRGAVAVINGCVCCVTWRGQWSVLAGLDRRAGKVACYEVAERLGLSLAAEVQPTDAQMIEVAKLEAWREACAGCVRDRDVE